MIGTVLVMLALALGWGIWGWPVNAQHLCLQFQLGKRDFQRNAGLRCADLAEANLSGASLMMADLTGADLGGTSFDEINLYLAHLSDANPSDA